MNQRRSMSSLLCMAVLICGCGEAPKKQPLPATWSTGYWHWADGQGTLSAPPLDSLFIHVGDIRLEKSHGQQNWAVSGYWPDAKLPSAKEHWLVFRFDQQGVPDIATAATLGERIRSLLANGPIRHLNIVGVQLDIDSPTGRLSEYAKYLSAVRKELTEGQLLSITALLDWFRDGTNIDAVIEKVDEFVPQFYDVADRGNRLEAIAAKVDAAKWAPRFNRFGKRYRVGISTFGRAAFVSDHPQPGSPTVLYGGVTPFDLGPTFALETTRNDAGEVVLTYRATRETSVDYQRFRPGEGVQFIVPTPDGVRAAAAEAKKMGGYAAGVVFFRWLSRQDSLFVSAEEILGETAQQTPSAEVEDGGCVAVKCVDVTLRHADRFAPVAVKYRVSSSEPLDYFLPNKGIPVRLSAPNEVELTVPPYAGRDWLELGRAVSTNAVTFTVEAVR